MLACVACGPDLATTPGPSSPPDSGVRGIVLLGPTCADQDVDASPCVSPYAARLVIVDADGTGVASVDSAADGTFQVTLPPGDYQILGDAGPDGDPTAQPVAVSVPPDTFVDVEVDYDTGIR
jgi:hypothetical protein